jgi:cleavage and polyadenylation specificity factor subunit 4
MFHIYAHPSSQWHFQFFLNLFSFWFALLSPPSHREFFVGEVCTFFLRGNCKRGMSCTFRHVKSEKTVVCKHWLRSLCKKGENCEFLHQYDLSKMPECYFFSKFGTYELTISSILRMSICRPLTDAFLLFSPGECSNPDCVYLHINPDEKIAECPLYARGFCKQGAFYLNCRAAV